MVHRQSQIVEHDHHALPRLRAAFEMRDQAQLVGKVERSEEEEKARRDPLFNQTNESVRAAREQAARQAALARELREELDIIVGQTTPLLEIHHDYGDKDVFLDCGFICWLYCKGCNFLLGMFDDRSTGTVDAACGHSE